MDIQRLSENYSVRRLDENDTEQIYALCRKNHIFYQYHPPLVTRESISEDMRALPPHTPRKNKFYLGFFDKKSLVAILDLILDYPAEKMAFIGLFMMNTAYQNRGIGSAILREVLQHLQSLGYKEVRLGVDKGNPQSHAFWVKNGFVTTGEKQYLLMSRKTAPFAQHTEAPETAHRSVRPPRTFPHGG